MSSCPQPPTRGPQAVPSPPPGTPPVRGPGRTRGDCQSCRPEDVHTPHMSIRCAEPAEQLHGTLTNLAAPGSRHSEGHEGQRSSKSSSHPAGLVSCVVHFPLRPSGLVRAWTWGFYMGKTTGRSRSHRRRRRLFLWTPGSPRSKGGRQSSSPHGIFASDWRSVFFSKLEGRHPTWECQKVRGKPERDMLQPRPQIPPGEARLAGGQRSGQRSRREEALAGQGCRWQRPPLQVGAATQQTLPCNREKELPHGCR